MAADELPQDAYEHRGDSPIVMSIRTTVTPGLKLNPLSR